MRYALPLIAVLCAVLLAWAVLSSSDDHGEPAPAPGVVPPPSPDGQSRADELSIENRRLREEIKRLGEEIAELKASLRALVSRPGAGPTGEAVDPKVLLESYVLSFVDNNRGSRFYRLAVEAAAPSILDEIGAILIDPSKPRILRLALLSMLADGRFRGDPRAIRILTEVLDDEDSSIGAGALHGLSAIGGTEAVAALKGRVWSLSPSVLNPVLATIVRSSGQGANRLLSELLVSAPDDAAWTSTLALVQTSDPRIALDIFRRASGRERAVRAAAAGRISAFRDPEIRAFTKQWSETERDPGVKQQLVNALQKQSSIPSWDAMRAAGRPNVSDVSGDDPNAWASKDPDGGREWLELTYEIPMRANMVRIHEVHAGGAVVAIEAQSYSGNRQTVWEGDDPRTTPGVSEIGFALTPFPVKKIRVILDTKRQSGWNEIDAVQLVGPDGSAWAKSAAASSTYGQ